MEVGFLTAKSLKMLVISKLPGGGMSEGKGQTKNRRDQSEEEEPSRRPEIPPLGQRGPMKSSQARL